MLLVAVGFLPIPSASQRQLAAWLDHARLTERIVRLCSVAEALTRSANRGTLPAVARQVNSIGASHWTHLVVSRVGTNDPAL